MRFPLFTDNHVREPILAGLRRLGWTVTRAIDSFPEATPDEILFEYAARHGCAIVTNDKGIHRIAVVWIAQSRPYRMIFWEQGQGGRGAPADGAVIAAIEALAQNPYAFGYPIEYIKGGR
ncbi:MAG: DUF5615 family PIN-like protein [Vicinamibacteria bacterium]